MKQSKAALFGFALAASSMVAGPAFGQSVEDFYRDKTLTLIVSADAGTVTDTIARQFARFFVKYIPGEPQPVVQNIVGAGGMVAAASLQTKLSNDGTVIGLLQRNNLYTPLLDPTQTNFDPREVEWLGSLDKVHYSLVAMSRSGVGSVEGLFENDLIIGATGFSNENRILPAMLNEYIGTKMNIVPGYTGRSEVYLAMERGEVDGWASTTAGLHVGEPARMLDDGSLKVLLQMAWESHPDFPDAPNLSDYVTDPEVRALFGFFLSPLEAGRPIAVSNDVPQERLDALNDAFMKTIEDPEFIEVMKDSGFPIDAIDGDAVEKIISKLYSTPDTVIEEALRLRNL
tara:strand:+ start:863 stop:1891 length:1029 start_codon:yes stop_codon:yes gene_type:complete